MASRAMLVAVNRELKAMPTSVAKSATAELARELARDFDFGMRTAAGPLRSALNDLRRMTAASAKSAATATAQKDEAEVTDELDDLARARATRIAAASGVVRPIGGHERRTGGAAAR